MASDDDNSESSVQIGESPPSGSVDGDCDNDVFFPSAKQLRPFPECWYPAGVEWYEQDRDDILVLESDGEMEQITGRTNKEVTKSVSIPVAWNEDKGTMRASFAKLCAITQSVKFSSNKSIDTRSYKLPQNEYKVEGVVVKEADIFLWNDSAHMSAISESAYPLTHPDQVCVSPPRVSPRLVFRLWGCVSTRAATPSSA